MQLISTLVVTQYLPLRLLVDILAGKPTAPRTTIKHSAEERELKN